MRETRGVFVDPRADDARRFRVLVVDDEPDIVSVVQRLIETELPHARVIGASGAADAVREVRERPVDLVVTDFRMPVTNGLELLAELRSISKELPAIMLTAFADLDLAMDAINEHRVEKFLTKPVDARRLVAAVREALERVRAAELRDEAFQKLARSLKG